MTKLTFQSICLILTLVFITAACKKTSDPAPAPILKIGLVGGIAGFSDSGFNQNILTGLQKAAIDFPILCQSYEVWPGTDFTAGINYFLYHDFDLIITTGFDASEATLAAVNAHPEKDFAIIDFEIPSPPSNLLCIKFNVDQASFPCGFLAAFWANKQNNVNPVAGYVAGPDIPEIHKFAVSYLHGIEYFNTVYKKNVASVGYYATSFSDTIQGARLADSLMKQNASVIFAFAGQTGVGTLYKIKEARKWAIGVDVDQFYSVPPISSVLLTSCMKRLDVVVYDVLNKYYHKDFAGGTTIYGNLNNDGVGLAPFHNYNILIPDSIKTALNAIETGIKNGTILTGWPGK